MNALRSQKSRAITLARRVAQIYRSWEKPIRLPMREREREKRDRLPLLLLRLRRVRPRIAATGKPVFAAAGIPSFISESEFCR